MITSKQIANLPTVWPEDLGPSIRESLVSSNRTIVVLDDDPTGTQTVYDVPVLTRFEESRIGDVLRTNPPMLFLSTNSRAMDQSQTQLLHQTLAATLKLSGAAHGRQIELISRSDSTLRGHYPLETDTLSQHWPEQGDVVLIMPFFKEGGRLTINGQHYVQEGESFTPAHETPFAQDKVFGFNNSYMPDYVEEKTNGRVRAGDVIIIPIDVIRTQGPAGVQAIFDQAPPGSVCVADGVVDQDAQVIAAAVGRTNRSIMARVAASYVRARAGLQNKPLLDGPQLQSEGNGGLIVIGSHVPKTTSQLDELLRQHPECVAIELSVSNLLNEAEDVIKATAARVDQGLTDDKTIIVYTSRDLVSGSSDKENLKISETVSGSLVQIVQQIRNRPRYVLAKGGITSADVASKGLGVELAQVTGSILPGVPVWKLGSETRFPGIYYVIFPGNVGDDDALAQAVSKLDPTKSHNQQALS